MSLANGSPRADRIWAVAGKVRATPRERGSEERKDGSAFMSHSTQRRAKFTRVGSRTTVFLKGLGLFAALLVGAGCESSPSMKQAQARVERWLVDSPTKPKIVSFTKTD